LALPPRWLLSAVTMSMGMNTLCLIALLLAVASATTVVDLSTIPACQINGCTSQCDVKQYLPSGLSGDVEFMSSKSGDWCVAANNNYAVGSLTLSGQVTFSVNGELSIQSMTSTSGSTFQVGNEASFFGNANIGGYFGGFAAGVIIFIEGALTTTSTSTVAITEGRNLILSSSGATFGGSVSGTIDFEGTSTIAATAKVSGVTAGLQVSSTININADCSFTNFFLSSQFYGPTIGVVNIAQGVVVTSAALNYYDGSFNPPTLTINGPGKFVVNGGVAIGAGTLSLASSGSLSFSGTLTGTGIVNVASGSTLTGTTSTFSGAIVNQNSAPSSSYLGCYNDQSSRDLSYEATLTSSLTVEGCISACAGYDYAGVQDGNQCFCGDTYGKYGSAGPNACSMACQGDNTQICGGAWLNSVYKV